MVLLVKSHRIYVGRSSYMIHRLPALAVALAVMIVLALLAQLPATAQTQSSAAKCALHLDGPGTNPHEARRQRRQPAADCPGAGIREPASRDRPLHARHPHRRPCACSTEYPPVARGLGRTLGG